MPHRRLTAAAVVAAIAVAHNSLLAVEHAEICRFAHTAEGAGAATTRHYAPDRQVDVQHIKLDVTPDFEHASIAGAATLRFAPIAKPLESLRLDAVDLRVTAVRSSHTVRDWSAGADDLTVVFDAPISVDEQAWVEIDYSAEPIEGLYFRTPAMGVPASDVHCWTQGETHEARHWFPCFDYPNERSTTELVCHVPAEMTVVSNGRLVSEVAGAGAGLKTVHWLQDKPHVSYLLCFVAGRLEKLTAQHGDVPLGFYTQPSKAAYAANPFTDTADIMAFFEAEIGVDYPWAKYDQATIGDFMWGGMENTTLTTLTQRTLYEDAKDDFRSARARSLNAHEMAHQWFGDYVTCKDWSHLWLNEGFATYYALLYEGHKSGRDAMLYGLYLDARDEILLPENLLDLRPIVFRTYEYPQDQFDFRNYPKASWVLHMLRSQVGDELFRRAIHTYLERHALGEVETEDLREVFEELSGKPLDRFFDQWLYHGGVPELKVTYRWLAKEQLAHVSVVQTQTASDDVLTFEFPMTLRFVVDGKTVDEAVDVTERQHDFYVKLPAEPTIVRFDPEYTLLAKVAFDKSVALFEADLKNEADMIGRVLACEGLAKQRTSSAVAALRNAVQNDSFYGVREAAARALREMRTEEATAALVASVSQADARVRRAVVEELGQCYDDAARAKLIAIAGDADESALVAAAAIESLGRTSGEDASRAIRAALAGRSFHNDRVRAAFLAIRDTNDAAWGPELMDAIAAHETDVDSRDLTEGFLTLAQISQRGRRRDAAYDFLAAYLESPREPVRLAAVEALGELHDPRVRTLLGPYATAGRDDRMARAAKAALKVLDDRGEFVPDEIGELRREVRELREAQEKLKGQLKTLESKDSAEKNLDDDAAARETAVE